MLFVLRGIQNPYGNPWIPCFAVKLGFFTGSIRSFIFKIYFIIANIVIKTVQTPAKKIQRIANIKFFWQIDAGILDFVYKLLFLADDPVNIADPFAALLCEILRFVADLGAGSILNGLTVANLTAEVIQFFYHEHFGSSYLKRNGKLIVILCQSWNQGNTCGNMGWCFFLVIFELSSAIGVQQIVSVHVSGIRKIAVVYIITNIEGKCSCILAPGIIRIPAPVFSVAFRASASCISNFLVREKKGDAEDISASLEGCFNLAKALTVHPVVAAGNICDIHFLLAIDGFPVFSVFGGKL